MGADVHDVLGENLPDLPLPHQPLASAALRRVVDPRGELSQVIRGQEDRRRNSPLPQDGHDAEPEALEAVIEGHGDVPACRDDLGLGEIGADHERALLQQGHLARESPRLAGFDGVVHERRQGPGHRFSGQAKEPEVNGTERQEERRQNELRAAGPRAGGAGGRGRTRSRRESHEDASGPPPGRQLGGGPADEHVFRPPPEDLPHVLTGEDRRRRPERPLEIDPLQVGRDRIPHDAARSEGEVDLAVDRAEEFLRNAQIAVGKGEERIRRSEGLPDRPQAFLGLPELLRQRKALKKRVVDAVGADREAHSGQLSDLGPGQVRPLRSQVILDVDPEERGDLVEPGGVLVRNGQNARGKIARSGRKQAAYPAFEASRDIGVPKQMFDDEARRIPEAEPFVADEAGGQKEDGRNAFPDQDGGHDRVDLPVAVVEREKEALFTEPFSAPRVVDEIAHGDGPVMAAEEIEVVDELALGLAGMQVTDVGEALVADQMVVREKGRDRGERPRDGDDQVMDEHGPTGTTPRRSSAAFPFGSSSCSFRRPRIPCG